MSQTRREFLLTSAAALATAAVLPHEIHASPPLTPDCSSYLEPAWIEGDPYTASACSGGLGGRSFDAAREHALRFRSTPEDRDRYVLGLEI